MITKLNFYTYLFIIVFTLSIFFGYYKIGTTAINNDANFWYFRTQNFVKALEKNRLNETYQNAKPGVTVMWLSGLSLETFLTLYEKIFHFRPFIYTYETFYLSHFTVIAPLVTVNLLAVLVFYVFGSRIFSQKPVLFALILLAFQPFYIGISQIFHADSVVAAFMLMSVIFGIYYISSSPRQVFLILSGICAGLALLSKSSAIFLIPYFGLLVLIDFGFNKKPVLYYAKFYLIWLIVGSATFFVLFPAMWFKPLEILRRIFVDEGLYLATTGRDGISGFLFYSEPILRVLTFPILISFLHR